jgi:L-ribulose-5-phosphate 3-epimerase
MTCPPIGIMLGRLSPPVEGAIQAFPAGTWAEEFAAAEAAGFAFIEWLYKIDDDEVNPFWTDAGQTRLKELQARHRVVIPSLCADYFMPAPLLRGSPAERQQRRERLLFLLRRARQFGIPRVILPFLDASRIEDGMIDLMGGVFAEGGAGIPDILLECSLPPAEFGDVLHQVNHPRLLVNYDSGNSASLGYDADEEFAAYGTRIGSVHIKDRVLGGATVPLGEGDADYPKLLRNLEAVAYSGNFILEAARSTPSHELAWGIRNRKFVENWFAPQ